MTPIERKVMLSMLRTIKTCIANMAYLKTDFNDIACLNEMVIALDFCIDTFEHADD